MGNFTSVDLQKFQDRGLISSFEMKDGWLTLRGSGNSNCSEMRDIISLHLGFEPNAADVWRQGKKYFGVVIKRGEKFEIFVKAI